MDFLSLNGFPGKLIDLGPIASFKSKVTRLFKHFGQTFSGFLANGRGK